MLLLALLRPNSAAAGSIAGNVRDISAARHQIHT